MTNNLPEGTATASNTKPVLSEEDNTEANAQGWMTLYGEVAKAISDALSNHAEKILAFTALAGFSWSFSNGQVSDWGAWKRFVAFLFSFILFYGALLWMSSFLKRKFSPKQK